MIGRDAAGMTVGMTVGMAVGVTQGCRRDDGRVGRGDV